MTMRTPLNKVRFLGAAHTGTEHFWHQRLTAIANIPLTIFLIWLVLSLTGAGHASVIALVGHPLVAFGLTATIISFVWHMRLGMQVVIEDYVHGPTMKYFLIISNNLFSAFILLMSLYAILKISLGA